MLFGQRMQAGGSGLSPAWRKGTARRPSVGEPADCLSGARPSWPPVDGAAAVARARPPDRCRLYLAAACAPPSAPNNGGPQRREVTLACPRNRAGATGAQWCPNGLREAASLRGVQLITQFSPSGLSFPARDPRLAAGVGLVCVARPGFNFTP